MFETDDEDFALTPSSKLASVFNATSIPDTNNASLHYKAPKQPKPLDSNMRPVEKELNCDNQTRAQSLVKLAKVITLWKSDNGKDKVMGKYMVAIIGSSSKDVFEMIIYQEKTKITIRETLGSLFNVYSYPNNFVAIYDSKGNLWNLNFDSSEGKDSFLQHANQYNCVIIDHTKESNQRNMPNESSNDDSPAANKNEKNTLVSGANAEQISSKEKILSRITKMGQQILPRTIGTNKSSELSESETESSYSDHSPPKPVTTPRKFKRNLNNHEKALAPILTESNNNSSNILTPRLPSNNTSFCPNNHLLLNHQNSGIVYSQQLPDYGLSNFIIAQNAELKANLAEISMKLNNVLSSTNNNGNNSEDTGSLHSKIKCQNLKIDNLSTDLERMRKALNELTKKYHEKCEALNAELNKNELLDQHKAEVNNLRHRMQNMNFLHSEIEDLKQRLQERDNEIDSKSSKLKDFEEYFQTSEFTKENLSKQVTDLNLKLEEAALQVNKLEDEIKQKGKDLSLTQNESLALDRDEINKLVKESMNEAFSSIMENFSENEVYSFNNIQGVILDNLKKTSYRLMNSLL